MLGLFTSRRPHIPHLPIPLQSPYALSCQSVSFHRRQLQQTALQLAQQAIQQALPLFPSLGAQTSELSHRGHLLEISMIYLAVLGVLDQMPVPPLQPGRYIPVKHRSLTTSWTLLETVTLYNYTIQPSPHCYKGMGYPQERAKYGVKGLSR